MIKKIFILFLALSILSCRKNAVIIPLIDFARIKSDVCKLITHYELDDTGKAYWIGYNNMMQHIAGYGDAAIEPLMTFIDTTKNIKAKYAACLTIHYIGINRTVVGRDREEFKNEKARKALLRLLKYEDLQYTVMSLLVRNPWQSDVPALFNVIKSSNDCWPVCNGLERYWLPNPPIKNKTRELLNAFYITIKHPKKPYKNDEFNAMMFRNFIKKYKGMIQIEDTLFNYRFYYSKFICIPSFYNIDTDCSWDYDTIESANSVRNIYLDDLLHTTKVNYCNIGNNFNYFEKNDTLFICSSLTAKKRWIDWWTKNDKAFLITLEKSKK